MIDPRNVTNFNRTRQELEEFLLFCIVAAGKNSFVQAKKLNHLLEMVSQTSYPFVKIRILSGIAYGSTIPEELLTGYLKITKMGQYKRIARAFIEATKIDPANCSLEDLTSIPGVGAKTARFFLVHSRPNQLYAILDTHILKWMRVNGVNTPKNTPSKKKYLELENKFISMVPGDKTVAEFDLEIWNSYAK
jgi:thermostable 8-oxoguanine DNA glycosylase